MRAVTIGGQPLIETSPDVFYGDGVAPLLDRAARQFLRERAGASPKRQCRICLHDDPAASLHEMAIAQTADFYSRPHRHLHKTEAYLIIEGEADLLRFGDDGAIIGVTALAPDASHYCKMEPMVWHALHIRSALVIYHEIAPGPFDPAGSEFAPWAPTDATGADANGWRRKLDAAVAEWRKEHIAVA